MGLCIVAGLIALAFLAVLLIDTIRQRRKLARLRPAQTKATKRTAAE